MITKEIIRSEIEKLNDEDLDKLYEIIKNFTNRKHPVKQPSLLSKLRQISIDGPEDFAANLDLYVSGEKHA